MFLSHLCTGFDGCSIRFGRRGCYHRILTGVLVTCDGAGTETEVPQNIPPDTVYISLNNFKLGNLRKQDFGFVHVECLTITESDVGSVDRDAFSAMESLHELILTDTRLTTNDLAFVDHPTFAAELLTISDSPNLRNLTVDATATLHQLKTLQLAGNNLDIISPRLFPELRHVERLDLSRNNLRSLDWEGLREIPNLNQLMLDSNRFQTLPEYMHDVFFAVKELSLGSNPLHCNCKLAWLRDFYHLATDKVLDIGEVMCASPNVISMSNAADSDFTCSKPTLPLIQWNRLPDHRFEVNCSAEGDPAPTLTLSLPDGRVVISPPAVDISILTTTTPQIVSYGGQVVCSASNSVGESEYENTENLPVDPAAQNLSPSRMPSTVYIFAMTSLAVVCHVIICAAGS